VPAPKRWYSFGRGLVGLVLFAAGVTIAVASATANAWFGMSLATDKTAAWTFATLTVMAEVVAAVVPAARRFYWHRREWLSCLTILVVLIIALTVVALASSGFVIQNVSDAIMARADHTTASVAIAEAALANAKGARDRECYRNGGSKAVGPICRQREDIVNERQAALDQAKAEVRLQADPLAGSLHISSRDLQTIKASAMVVMCLAAGLIIALGYGLMFAKTGMR